MKIQIFDVEHGACALVTADNGARILIDAGHNSSTNWRPSGYFRKHGIRHLQKLIITNYDEDHASDLEDVLDTVSIDTLTTNPSVTGDDLRKLKRRNGIGNGIAALARMKSLSFTASAIYPPDLGEVQLRYFWNRYPTDFEDENNLSLVVILKAYGLTICFPGDMEEDGWLNLLRDAAFVTAMGEVNVLVASHHGRDNGCCCELFYLTGMTPAVVIISDSGIEHATQGTVNWYAERATGIRLNWRTRRVLTTRGRILIEATPYSTTVGARQPVRWI